MQQHMAHKPLFKKGIDISKLNDLEVKSIIMLITTKGCAARYLESHSLYFYSYIWSRYGAG